MPSKHSANSPIISLFSGFPKFKQLVIANGFAPTDIKTATLWKKKKSTFEPDFCAVKLDTDPWIVQPFEIYEEIRIEDIKKKHQK